MAKEIATFGAGCFWGVQKSFDELQGVLKTTVGYIGGKTKNPTYDQVCTHTTGHAEAIEIEYGPKIISYENLLEHFFKIHNPTQLNKQGPDVGSNYRSAVFYHDKIQKKQAEEFIKKLNESKKYTKPVATTLEKASQFYPAEEYHQKYYKKNDFFACHI
ncbi:MAG: peptide-methionine (S)-S-oxide reductase MsrA [Candidatus Micrarchaeota archaeon]